MNRDRSAAASPVANAFSGPFGVVLMALTWAVGWGLGLGGLMEILDSSGQIADIWFSVLGIPGLLTGALFWLVLRVTEGRRRIDEISPARMTGWGALTGALLGVLLSSLGFARPQFDGLWVRSLVLIGAATVLCALSAAAVSVLVRTASRRSLSAARSVG